MCCFSVTPTKRSQHAYATFCNIFGRKMLRVFGHRVAMCCDMLGVVGSSLKKAKRTQHIAPKSVEMLLQKVAIVWPGL